MKLGRSFPLLGLFAVKLLAQVGAGAPSSIIQSEFVEAWNRGGFNLLVGPPLGNVTRYGSTGLIQQFPSATNSTGTLALIKPDTTGTDNVVQMQAAMFAYYGTISVTVAGYPTADTASCPPITANSCQWQPFSSNYVLFTYTSPTSTGGGQNFALRDPFFTKWVSLGGISGSLGPANSAETSVTSNYGSGATVQTYVQGAIYNITSGLISGRLLAVKEPVYDLYVSNGASAGFLGLPLTEELVLPNGMKQQSFEGGSIQYDPSTGIAVLRPQVASVTLTPSGSLHMNLGDTLTVQATDYDANGVVLSDRTVIWSTSNGKVIQIQSNGSSATLKAVGPGAATVTATSEAKVSSQLIISVTSPCCQIGEGAPTAAIQQAFQDAVTRNKLSVQIPVASPVLRLGNGYVQQMVSTAAAPVPYLVAVPDGSVAGYVVGGSILSQYLALGGPAGPLGYPQSDATAAGRQMFQQGALAGNPVQLVSGSILAKWAALGYETGTAGSPVSAASPFQTFRGTAGSMQSFQNALIIASSSGPLAGQTFAVSGLVLTAYSSDGGPTGDLGAPTDDEHATGGLRQQDFEGGYLNYAPGAAVATLFSTPRQPLVTATPNSVASGGTVHLAAGGFDNGATVQVSQTGQPDFVVQIVNGAYAWDVVVPATAPSSVVAVRAVDVNTGASAQGSYTIRAAGAGTLTISVVSGDQQNGAPGAQLAQPLVVVLRDANGNPVAGQTVSFNASPGAQVNPATAITGANGQASTTLRMQMSEGIALATAQAAHQLVTFSAKSAAFSLTNFPALTQAVAGTLGNGSDPIAQKGAFLASVASILRYHQLRNELAQQNGLADPLTLNQFLKSFCVSDAQANQICDGFVSFPPSTEQTVNLWRVAAFTGSGIDVRVVASDLNSIRDLVNAGAPVLLALSLTGLGSHFVVATGIASNGDLAIADPAFSQTRLASYLNGFNGPGGTVLGTLSGAVRLVPGVQSSAQFLVVANAAVQVSSAAGACGQTLQFPGTAASASGKLLAQPSGLLYFQPCDGSTGPYQLDIAAQSAYNGTFTDLTPNGGRAALTGSGPTSSEILRSGTHWSLAPLTLTISAVDAANTAGSLSQFAPGSLISVYGAGFVQAGSVTTAQVNGEDAIIVAALPFLVNLQIPFDIPTGSAVLSVTSGNGTAQQSIAVNDVAPAIFVDASGQAAIMNPDGSLNAASNPALRGTSLQIFATGLGVVSADTGVAVTPVFAVIGGTAIPADFAGLTSDAIGVYRVEVQIPSNLPPGLSLPLYLVQGDGVSNIVNVAIQ